MSRPRPPLPANTERRTRRATKPYAFHNHRPAGAKLAHAAKRQRITIRAPQARE